MATINRPAWLAAVADEPGVAVVDAADAGAALGRVLLEPARWRAAPNEGGAGMLKEFKTFLMRGNVIDLAVAVVLGAAFGLVIASIVDNLITPILGLFGDQDFSQYGITLKEGEGATPTSSSAGDAILTAIINFIAVAAAIFFLVVKPVNMMVERRKRGEGEPEDTPAPSTMPCCSPRSATSSAAPLVT